MEKYVKRKLNRNDHKPTTLLASVIMATRIVLTPIFMLVRIYCWIWDYDYIDRFKSNY